jgi:hypothetical protein
MLGIGHIVVEIVLMEMVVPHNSFRHLFSGGLRVLLVQALVLAENP